MPSSACDVASMCSTCGSRDAAASVWPATLRSSASARLACPSAASVAPEARYAAARLAHARPSWYLSGVPG